MPPENDDPSQNGSTESPNADEALNQKINSVMTAHLRRFAEKQLPTLLESALKPIHEKLSAPPPVKDEEEAKGKGKDKISPEMQALQAKLAEFETKYAQEAKARQDAEKRSRDEKAQNELRSALQSQVKPELLEILADNLYHRKQVVEFDEETGGLIFKSKKTDYLGNEEEVRMPLKAGVEQFLKSPDAKPFLPAPGSASAQPMKKVGHPASGGQSGPIDPSKMTDAQKIQRAMEIEAQFHNKQR